MKNISDFRKDIEVLINSHSMENGSNTADYILAEYLTDCLQSYDKAVNARDDWYGVKHSPGNIDNNMHIV